MPRQLSLDLETVPAMGREAYFVSETNARAVHLLDNWRDWPERKFMLLGPTASGKTHLAHVWAALSDARIIGADQITNAMVPDLARGNLALENIHLIAGDLAAQQAVFHLYNLMTAEGHALLLTGRGTLASWDIALKDLASRLATIPSTTLPPPDDSLLGAVLAKLFEDRQLSPAPEVVNYLVRHMPRSLHAAARLVAALDAEALEGQRPISRPLAIHILSELDLNEFTN